MWILHVGFVSEALKEAMGRHHATAISGAVVEILERFDDAPSNLGLKPLAVILLAGVRDPSAQSRKAAMGLLERWLNQGVRASIVPARKHFFPAPW